MGDLFYPFVNLADQLQTFNSGPNTWLSPFRSDVLRYGLEVVVEVKHCLCKQWGIRVKFYAAVEDYEVVAD